MVPGLNCPCWLAFMVVEGAVSTGGEKTWMVLPSCEPYELQYQPARQDVSPCAIVALTEMEVTNHSLIGFVNSLTGENLCLVL